MDILSGLDFLIHFIHSLFLKIIVVGKPIFFYHELKYFYISRKIFDGAIFTESDSWLIFKRSRKKFTRERYKKLK